VRVHPLHVINADSVSTIRLNQQISTLRPVGYCHPHPHCHLWLLVGAKADIHFTIPQRVEAASAVFFSGGSHKQNCPWRASFQGFLLSQFDVLAQDHGDPQREKWALHIGCTCVFTDIHQSVGCTYFVLCQEHTVLLYIMSLCTCLVSKLVSWCLMSLSSTNMAISETKSQGWRAIPTQYAPSLSSCKNITTLWPVLISLPTDGRRLSWPGCTHQFNGQFPGKSRLASCPLILCEVINATSFCVFSLGDIQLLNPDSDSQWNWFYIHSANQMAF